VRGEESSFDLSYLPPLVTGDVSPGVVSCFPLKRKGSPTVVTVVGYSQLRQFDPLALGFGQSTNCAITFPFGGNIQKLRSMHFKIVIGH
jgi:hypothetical protein